MFNNEEDFKKFSKTVEELIELFPHIDIYDFLYEFKNNVESPLFERDFYSNAYNCLNQKSIEYIIQKEIENSSSLADIRRLQKEIKNNLLVGSYESIFYLVHSLNERIADLILCRNKKKIKSLEVNDLKIKDYLNNTKFTLEIKIQFLEKLSDLINVDKDYYKYVKLLKLFQRIRNKVMFHRKNIENYSIYFDNISEKEDNLKKTADTLLSIIDEIKESFTDESQHINLIIKKSEIILDHYSDYLSRNKSNDEILIYHGQFIEELPVLMSHLSLIFIFFITKEELNFFKGNFRKTVSNF